MTGKFASGVSSVSRSAGVSVSWFRDGAVAYDSVLEQTHLLSRSAGWILIESTGRTLDDLVSLAARADGVPPYAVRDQIESGVEDLWRLGLLGGQVQVSRPPASGARGWGAAKNDNEGMVVGLTFPMLAERVAFRSSEPALLSAVEEFLGWGICDHSETRIVDLDRMEDEVIELRTPERWRFAGLSELFVQLPWILNQIAAQSTETVVLHAGAVRTPRGEVVLVTGESDAGKSTLVASLVQAGCDYLGDEAIGVASGSLEAVGYPKPLSLDRASCCVLGVDAPDVGHLGPEQLRSGSQRVICTDRPVDRIYLVRHQDVPVLEFAALSQEEALRVLLANTLNMAKSGESGLRTLCGLAEKVPVLEVGHPDARLCASVILDPSSAPGGAGLSARADSGIAEAQRRIAILTPSPINDFRPQRAHEFDFATVDVDGSLLGILKRDSAESMWLDAADTELWGLLDGVRKVAQLIELCSAEGDLVNRWRHVTSRLERMANNGLLDSSLVPGSVTDWGAIHCESALVADQPTRTSTRQRDLFTQVMSDPVNEARAVARERGLPSWCQRATVVAVDGVVVATDHPGIRDALSRAIDAETVRPVGVGEWPKGARRFVGLRVLPISGAGCDLWVDDECRWVHPEEELCAFATQLVAKLGVQLTAGTVPIRSAWLATHGSQAALLVRGEHVPVGDGALWQRAEGLHVDEGNRLWAVHQRNAAAWVDEGMPSDFHEDLWERYRFVVGVAGVNNQPDAWCGFADAIETNVAGRGAIRRVIADSTPSPMFGSDTARLAGRLAAEIGLPVRSTKPVERAKSDRTAEPDCGGRVPTSPFLDSWASLGGVSPGPESVKFHPEGISIGRPLLAICLGGDPTLQESDLRPIRGRLAGAFEAFGLGRHESWACADAALAGVQFFIREDFQSDGSWRRKIYMGGATPQYWRHAMIQWPEILPDSAESVRWLTWKVGSEIPGEVIRAVEIERLNGATTISQGISPAINCLPAEWQQAVQTLVEWIGIDLAEVPSPDHCLVYHSDGRVSVDLATGQWTEITPQWSRQGVLRFMTRLVGENESIALKVDRWMAGRSLARVVVGQGSDGNPSVILYTGRR